MIRPVKPVFVKPARVVTPQCCIEPDDNDRMRLWRQERYRQLRPDFDPQKCQRESVVEIDGKHYCGSHAGKVALNKWLSGDLVEKTTQQKGTAP
ncbi:hypothetical protein BjapCC829_21850 [Bradyrhizobium barranii]|uniref:GcrA cell cycle regulator n=1 Tax=Bradyrhizobium barranii TaxID=2992140 RepID=A0ABY3QYF9_9BRAD|nr:hypothetical protein [Bradyrhizobium japonicum]UFW91035.1 hypothetical protein BjapCC829_21850 [Bradyrhizobium japonicum]